MLTEYRQWPGLRTAAKMSDQANLAPAPRALGGEAVKKSPERRSGGFIPPYLQCFQNRDGGVNPPLRFFHSVGEGGSQPALSSAGARRGPHVLLVVGVRGFIRHYMIHCALGLALLLSVAGAYGQGASPVEIALGYSYVHSNAPVAGCGCFNMNGGIGGFAASLGHGFSAVAEAGGYFQNNVDNSGRSLQVETLLFGPRYSSAHWKRWTPFAQALFGGALGSGTLYGPNATTSGSASGFALSAGGGLDFNVSQHMSVRIFQADYLMTRLPNFINNYQNNFRISAGVVFHIGRPQVP